MPLANYSSAETVRVSASVKPSGVSNEKLPSGSGGQETPSGSGLLPAIGNIQWEWKPDGSAEAWHAPQGITSPRKTKTYLGRVGKRLLAEWEAMPPDERFAIVTRWIADRRTEKGIT
jgi:hypothetical protein